ncbi:MAG TPA: late competence development ComFB family protein [Patescibacteria group bacterium]|jgi:competence protein ComFB|nr:late competence development ComFB family protein [Patescibacteria group bacterium]
MYKLKNFMEEVVNKKIDSLLNIMNICRCEKCRMDIMAIALNDIPAKYVVTETGELYSKVRELEQQFEVDVETAIVKAALFVSKNPKH